MFAGTIVLFVLLGLIIYSIDPLQQYREAKFYKPYFSNQRYMNPGVAKNYQYDSVIVGTSMTENFIPSYMDSILGWKSVKLPMNGGSAYELSQVMKTVLEAGKAKNILFGLDVFSFKGSVDRVRYVELPYYLYDTNYWNDYHYLFNINILIKEILFKLIPSNILGINKDRLHKENPYFHYEKYKQCGQGDIFKNTAALTKLSNRNGDFSLEKFEKNFDVNILPLMQSNQDVTFHIFYPPYSILTWLVIDKEGWFEDAMMLKRHILEQTAGMTNVKIYDFQSAKNITHDFSNYRDFSHYCEPINREIIDAIDQNRYIQNLKNINAYINSLDLQVSDAKKKELLQ